MTLCCWCDNVALSCANGLEDHKCRDNACMIHKENHDCLCTLRLMSEDKEAEGLTN